MTSYELLEDVPQMVTRVVSQSGLTNATRCGQDGRWYNQTSDVVPMDAFGPWIVVQHSEPACDVCMQVPGALIPSAVNAQIRACSDCIKVLVLCPQCDRVANWTQQGDVWSCSNEVQPTPPPDSGLT